VINIVHSKSYMTRRGIEPRPLRLDAEAWHDRVYLRMKHTCKAREATCYLCKELSPIALSQTTCGDIVVGEVARNEFNEITKMIGVFWHVALSRRVSISRRFEGT
jgi:hypothetical protein